MIYKRLMLCILVLFAGLVSNPATRLTAGEPQAFMPKRVFDFKTVAEGSRITHDFVIYNKGDAPLEILELISICGCTAASSTEQILPGQEGRIQVTVKTDGYGGISLRENVRIKTSDPNNPWLEVIVTGKVEKIVDINPVYVRLAGPPGKKLQVDVEIRPKADYPFTITGISAENGKYIKYKLIQPCSEKQQRCVIRVENRARKKGRYTDILYLKTDSEFKPVISLQIGGIIE